MSDMLSANQSTANPARPLRNPRVRRIMTSISRHVFNPAIGVLAGRRHFPLFAIIRHRGRRSGRWYATPVAARPTPDGFVVPLTFGEQADWFRNIRAAGGIIRWKGEDYPVVEPTILDFAAVQSTFAPVERFVVSRFGIEYFARLRRAPVDAPMTEGDRKE